MISYYSISILFFIVHLIIFADIFAFKGLNKSELSDVISSIMYFLIILSLASMLWPVTVFIEIIIIAVRKMN